MIEFAGLRGRLAFVGAIIESSYILALILGLIVTFVRMLADVLVPSLGTFKPLVINRRVKQASSPEGKALSLVFKNSSETKGKAFFNVCANCHSIDKSENHKIGPNL